MILPHAQRLLLLSELSFPADFSHKPKVFAFSGDRHRTISFRSMTNQPSFHCIANIGDATPLLRGGAFVLVDKRGCYDPELLILEPEGSDRYGDPTSWKRYTIVCERLTEIRDSDGNCVALSGNPFLVNLAAWFASVASLRSLASFLGLPVSELAHMAVSSDPVSRAQFYKSAVEYHGHGNFQAEPEEMSRKEAKALCLAMAGQIAEARSWRNGWII
jgi:hypothetical protein